MTVSIKERYRVSRSIIRGNGRYGMRWVAPDLREAMNHMLDQAQLIDFLATRERMAAGRGFLAQRKEVFMLTCPAEVLLRYEMRDCNGYGSLFREQAH